MRRPGFEPGPRAWQARVLPLDYRRYKLLPSLKFFKVVLADLKPNLYSLLCSLTLPSFLLISHLLCLLSSSTPLGYSLNLLTLPSVYLIALELSYNHRFLYIVPVSPHTFSFQ